MFLEFELTNWSNIYGQHPDLIKLFEIGCFHPNIN